METALYSLYTALGLFVSGVLTKVLTSRDFRDFFILGVKNFFQHLAGKGKFTHHLFSNRDYYIGLAEDIELECPNKENLFRALLRIKITTAVDYTKVWIRDNYKHFRKWDKLKLRSEMSELVNHVVDTYEAEIYEEYYQILESREKGKRAFDLVYNGIEDGVEQDFKSFKELHKPQIDMIKRFIKNCPLYSNAENKLLVFQLLTMFDSALFTAIHEVKEVMSSINGRLC